MMPPIETSTTACSTTHEQETSDSLLREIRKLPMVRAREIDGEESDGTPISWRDRPFVSLTQLERLLTERAANASRQKARAASEYGQTADGARLILLGSTAPSPEATRLMTMLLGAFGSRHPAIDDLAALVLDGNAMPAPLSIAQLNECARDAQIDFALDKATSFEVAFARRIEAAHGICAALSTDKSGDAA